ncbi:MAG: hypothetical protein OMM_11631, partial [Candidatus Magnetoglobus multicellularis str. Araruama]
MKKPENSIHSNGVVVRYDQYEENAIQSLPSIMDGKVIGPQDFQQVPGCQSSITQFLELASFEVLNRIFTKRAANAIINMRIYLRLVGSQPLWEHLRCRWNSSRDRYDVLLTTIPTMWRDQEGHFIEPAALRAGVALNDSFLFTPQQIAIFIRNILFPLMSKSIISHIEGPDGTRAPGHGMNILFTHIYYLTSVFVEPTTTAAVTAQAGSLQINRALIEPLAAWQAEAWPIGQNYANDYPNFVLSIATTRGPAFIDALGVDNESKLFVLHVLYMIFKIINNPDMFLKIILNNSIHRYIDIYRKMNAQKFAAQTQAQLNAEYHLHAMLEHYGATLETPIFYSNLSSYERDVYRDVFALSTRLNIDIETVKQLKRLYDIAAQKYGTSEEITSNQELEWHIDIYETVGAHSFNSEDYTSANLDRDLGIARRLSIGTPLINATSFSNISADDLNMYRIISERLLQRGLNFGLIGDVSQDAIDIYAAIYTRNDISEFNSLSDDTLDAYFSIASQMGANSFAQLSVQELQNHLTVYLNISNDDYSHSDQRATQVNIANKLGRASYQDLSLENRTAYAAIHDKVGAIEFGTLSTDQLNRHLNIYNAGAADYARNNIAVINRLSAFPTTLSTVFETRVIPAYTHIVAKLGESGFVQLNDQQIMEHANIFHVLGSDYYNDPNQFSSDHIATLNTLLLQDKFRSVIPESFSAEDSKNFMRQLLDLNAEQLSTIESISADSLAILAANFELGEILGLNAEQVSTIESISTDRLAILAENFELG